MTARKGRAGMTKGKAYVLCFIAVMIIFLCVFLFVAIKDKAIEHIPVAACLTALVSATTAYMGIQMANNGVKGRNWNQEMYDSENGKEDFYDGTDKKDARGTG